MTALVLLLAACSTDVDSAPSAGPDASPATPPAPTVTLRLAVRQEGDRPPHLCAAALESNPPQCSTASPTDPVPGWDWAAAPGERTTAGVTIGGPYRLVGRWEPDGFRLTEPPTISPAHPTPASPAVPAPTAASPLTVEGDLVAVDVGTANACDGGCPIGRVAIRRGGSAIAPAGPATPALWVMITDATQLLGCGPTDALVPIVVADLAALRTAVTGRLPTTVWLAEGIAGRPAEPLRATAVTSGSCG